MSNTYNKSYASLQTVKHDTTVLDAQRIFIRTPQDSISSRTDIIDYINRKDTEVATNANNSINDIKNRLNGYDTQINNISSLNKRVTKIEERGLSVENTEVIPSMESLPSSNGELNAIRVNPNKVPHNVPLKAIEIPIPRTTTSESVYIELFTTVNGSTTRIGRSVNSVVLTGGINAVWSFADNFVIPENATLDIYFTKADTGVNNNGANYPGFHVACYLLNSGPDNIRYGANNDWYSRDVYIKVHKVIYTPLEDAIVDNMFGVDYLTIANTGSEFCEVDAINYSADKLPHNVVIDTIEFPVLNDITTPTYLAAWIITPANTKTYAGISDEAITWTANDTATWTFTSNPITIPDAHKLELYIVTTPPAEGAIEGTAPGHNLKVYCTAGTGDTRYNGGWTKNRDIRTSFRKIGHLNEFEERIEALENKDAGDVDLSEVNTRIDTLSDDVEDIKESIEVVSNEVEFSNLTGQTNEAGGHGIQLSKEHFISPGSIISRLHLPYRLNDVALTNQYSHIQFFDTNDILVKQFNSENTQSRTLNTEGISTWTYNNVVVPEYKYVRISLSGNQNDNPNAQTGTNCTKFRINVVNNGSGVEFDNDDCKIWDSGNESNFVAEVKVNYTTPSTVKTKIIEMEGRIETLENSGGNGATNPDALTKEVADTLYADKATTENAIGDLFSSAQFESAADSTQECECDSINYSANNVPHNVVIDTVEFSVLSSNIIPTYLAAWIINTSNVKSYVGMSDTAITWTQGGKATWTFTNNPINIPDGYKLELYIVTTPPATGAIEGTAPGHYLKVNCKNDTGTGSTRYNGKWTNKRDVRTSFRKIGYIESLENQINRLEEQVTSLEESNVSSLNTITNLLSRIDQLEQRIIELEERGTSRLRRS